MKTRIAINMPRYIDLSDISFLRFLPCYDARDGYLGLLQIDDQGGVTVSRGDHIAFKVPGNPALGTKYEERVEALFDQIASELGPEKLDVSLQFLTH